MFYIVCSVVLHCFVYVYFVLICFVCTSVTSNATGLELICNNNNNNNNNSLHCKNTAEYINTLWLDAQFIKVTHSKQYIKLQRDLNA